MPFYQPADWRNGLLGKAEPDCHIDVESPTVGSTRYCMQSTTSYTASATVALFAGADELPHETSGR